MTLERMQDESKRKTQLYVELNKLTVKELLETYPYCYARTKDRVIINIIDWCNIAYLKCRKPIENRRRDIDIDKIIKRAKQKDE